MAFYQTIDTYAKSMTLKVMFNTGAVPDQSYMGIDLASIVVDFEGTGATYTRTSFPTWTTSYAPARFANLVYSAGSGSVSTIASRARKNNVGNLYVTDGTLPNPWGQLASYFFSAELPGVRAEIVENVAPAYRALCRVLRAVDVANGVDEPNSAGCSVGAGLCSGNSMRARRACRLTSVR